MPARPGKTHSMAAGISRRQCLTAGALTCTGLTLAELLRAEDAAGIGSSQKSVVNIHLDGGPPQLDMIDLKPAAPAEFRGEFSPISTTLPGFSISEMMPRVAGIAEKFAFIRSLVGSAGAHDAFQCQSGFRKRDLQSIGGRPALGSVVAKLQGSSTDPAPSFVDLMQGRALVRNSARPGFLGPAFQPFRPDISQLFSRPLEAGMKQELKALGADISTSLSLNDMLSEQRLRSRTELLSGLDSIRRELDSRGMMQAMDKFTQQAVGILTSGRFAEAMDLNSEDPKALAKYGMPNNSTAERHVTSDGPDAVKKLLLARRLIEAGVRCVSVSISDFDTHRNNFPRLKQLLPIVDCALHAFVTDLDERGLLESTSIVVWGEFGRTPRIDTKTGGRHHWPRVGMALLAGGGMRTGQVIGATDRTAGTAISRPVSYKDIFATLYNNLGIPADKETLIDPTGRPQYLLDEGAPLPELV